MTKLRDQICADAAIKILRWSIMRYIVLYTLYQRYKQYLTEILKYKLLFLLIQGGCWKNIKPIAAASFVYYILFAITVIRLWITLKATQTSCLIRFKHKCNPNIETETKNSLDDDKCHRYVDIFQKSWNQRPFKNRIAINVCTLWRDGQC